MILYNGELLAYLGDSIYEMKIREFLLTQNIGNVNKMHKEAIKYTSGQSQAKFILKMVQDGFLSEEEISYYHRGRNANHSKNRRTISVIDYKNATGFEALIGFLYLSKQEDRINQIIEYIKAFVKEEENGK